MMHLLQRCKIFSEISNMKFYVLLYSGSFVFIDEGAAAKEPTELFIKNTGLC